MSLLLECGHGSHDWTGKTCIIETVLRFHSSDRFHTLYSVGLAGDVRAKIILPDSPATKESGRMSPMYQSKEEPPLPQILTQNLTGKILREILAGLRHLINPLLQLHRNSLVKIYNLRRIKSPQPHVKAAGTLGQCFRPIRRRRYQTPPSNRGTAHIYIFSEGVIQGILQGVKAKPLCAPVVSAQEAGCVLPKRIKATAGSTHDPTFLLRLTQAGYFLTSNAQVP